MASSSLLVACSAEECSAVTVLLELHSGFPKPGINFVDVFPLFRNPASSRSVTQLLARHVRAALPEAEVILGMEARGFLFGALLAAELGLGFCPVRKAGKLPGAVRAVAYDLEYGTAKIEMQTGHGFAAGAKALIVDDLIATGGTLDAAVTLAREVGFQVIAALVVVELTALGGSTKVPVPVHALIRSDA